jgi:FtsZ-interacting cell division protein YlmF
MSFLTGVMRLFGADDDYVERDQVVEYPARLAVRPQVVQEQPEPAIISMPDTDRSTLFVVRPERDDSGKPLFSVKTYADFLRTRQALVLDLNELASEDYEEAKRVVDYLSGAVEMLNGTVWEVTKNIFILAPQNVRIDGDPLKQVDVF